ncbi:aminodeoxychorismate synthase component I [Thalassococcus sp. BH17M4-6]|uniref:aminodeoxychorismate synthase component I n=1 Tax=Thalassococcus sp. BH17M4-6 TaxID=3413148 RepID=UPI003BBCDB9D
MKLLLVDNYDSFTWNVFDLIAKTTGVEPLVVKNDHPDPLDYDAFDAIILSPGPGHPKNDGDFGICRDITRRRDLPVLGICLGHQGICHESGARVSHAPTPCHGIVAEVHHDGDSILQGIVSPFRTVRYHSLAVTDLPPNFRAIAHAEDGIIMAVAANDRPHWGVQFHPESICSDFGAEIIRNFVTLAAAWQADTHAAAPKILTRRVRADCQPQELFDLLYSESDTALWLDNGGPTAEHRFSFIADQNGPLFEHLSYCVHSRTLTRRAGGQQDTTLGVDLFTYLRERLAQRRLPVPDGVPFQFNLGYAGYFGYELKALTGARPCHPASVPDAQLYFVDRLIGFDHITGDYWLLVLSETAQDRQQATDWLDTIENVLTAASGSGLAMLARATPGAVGAISFRHDREGYYSRISKCLDKIHEGESYEVCLTNMAMASCQLPGIAVYRRLRSVSPVPFGAFMRFGDLQILCASPERFLSVTADGMAESKPIKGTRPVKPDPLENQAMIDDLRSNAKDKAENLMIVDLLRNDLSRCCQVGSVHVSKLFEVESYSHVHQLVSTIRGQLRAEQTAVDALRATFPGGSMTGAPKLRTMEIIDSLEDGARGVYSGSLGYLSLCGAADLNIVIRSIVLDKGVATFGVGGAIIALSDIDEEYAETLVKARTSVEALGSAIAPETGPARVG